MLDIDDMERRHQFRFMTDKVPDKKIIDEIVSETFRLCPIKLGKWYFYIDVYGPEHYQEKRKFCLQTACDIPNGIDPAKLYQSGGESEKNINELIPILDGYIEDKKRQPGCPAFNTQILAPYVFAFRWNTKDQHKIQRGYHFIGASMFSYVMSVLANKKGLDASFCQCFFDNNYNYNSLYNSESDTTMFFLSLGYGDSSYHDSNEPKPDMKDVIKWM